MNTTVLEKIQSELERSGCDAFLLTGGDNMRYAAQVHLPFTDEHPGLAFVLFAKGRLPLVLSPSLWARSWERGIISDVRAYPGSLDATHAAAELAAFLRPLGLASIGLDMNRASVALREALGDGALTDISAAISAIRQIKSAGGGGFPLRISPTAPTMPSWGPPITASPVTPVRKRGGGAHPYAQPLTGL